jgi:hypothetical protein
MHHHAAPGWLAVINTIANLGIVGGYLLMPFTVLARLPLTRFVRVAGVLFFLGCAVSHLYMSMDDRPAWWLTVNHIVQAVAVWCFVLGFARLIRAASCRNAAGGGDRRGS